LGRRMNQYDLWPGFAGFAGHNAIFVRRDQNDLPEEVGRAFERCERQDADILTKGKKRMKFAIFKCYDFKGMTMRKTEDF
jgi:hypothetical protein